MVAKSQYRFDVDKSSYQLVVRCIKKDQPRIERSKTRAPKGREAATGNESDG